MVCWLQIKRQKSRTYICDVLGHVFQLGKGQIFSQFDEQFVNFCRTIETLTEFTIESLNISARGEIDRKIEN